MFFLLEGAPNTNSGGGLLTIGMLVLMIIFFYFFGIRPQKKQEKAAQEMKNSLSVGDEITTIGGIIGKIVYIKEETCIIETGREHTRIRILKSAIKCIDVKAEDAE
jgi:preprotein translocase subunit YajC